MLLPADWQPREQHPDYRIDYIVEIFENEQPTGLSFAVQLKGTGSLDESEGSVRVRIETDHLAYYMDRVTSPVFLVVVDVERDRGYWTFVQAYALDDLAGKDWRQQGTVTIKIPIENDLSDTARLHEAVRGASKRMAELHPAAITGAIVAEQRRIQNLDPRFNVCVEGTEQGIQCKLSAKQPVDVAFTLKGRPGDLPRKHEELLLKGNPITVAPGEVEVTGTRLFDELTRAGGALHWSRKYNASVTLVGKDRAGLQVASIEHIPGELEGGLEELRFDGRLPNSPFRIRFPINVKDGPERIQITVELPAAGWHGQRIRSLAYFEQIEGLLGFKQAIVTIEIELFVDGNRLFSGVLGSDMRELLRQASPFLEILRKARHVAERFSVNPTFPADFNAEHAHDVEELFALVTTGEYRRRALGQKVTIKVLRDGLRSFLNAPDSEWLNGTLTLNSSGARYSFLGDAVSLGPMQLTLTHSRLNAERSQLRRFLETDTAHEFALEFEGTDDSEWITEMTTDANGTVMRPGGGSPEVK